MLQLVLRWQNDSLAAVNTTISSGQLSRGPASAASSPLRLGTSAE